MVEYYILKDNQFCWDDNGVFLGVRRVRNAFETSKSRCQVKSAVECTGL